MVIWWGWLVTGFDEIGREKVGIYPEMRAHLLERALRVKLFADVSIVACAKSWQMTMIDVADRSFIVLFPVKVELPPRVAESSELWRDGR